MILLDSNQLPTHISTTVYVFTNIFVSTLLFYLAHLEVHNEMVKNDDVYQSLGVHTYVLLFLLKTIKSCISLFF